MMLYTQGEIKQIMEDNYEKSMDLVAFYHNLLVAFKLKEKPAEKEYTKKDLEDAFIGGKRWETFTHYMQLNDKNKTQ